MDKKEKWNLELSEYIKEGEPSRVEKTKTWETAIGLQEVDGLKPSEYLIETAKEHIEGNIDLKEVEKRINNYYKVLDNRKKEEIESSEEADKVAVRITELLSEKSFNFNPTELVDYVQSVVKGNNYTLEEQAIINVIKVNPSIRQDEIAKMINKSLRTVKTRMIEMQEKGLIARKNGKRNGEWVVLE